MGLKDEISKGAITALKAKDSLRVSTLRFLLSAIKLKEKDLKRDMEEGEIGQLAMTQVKQRQDSIDQFTKGGRVDLAEKEAAEIEILKAFMPEQMGEDEVRAIIKETAKEIGAEKMKDMGSLMKAVMAKLKGKAEGKLINEIVKETLAG